MNKYQFHLVIVPEDDANRQLALGLASHPRVHPRQIDLRPPAGGWSVVRDALQQKWVAYLRSYPNGYALFLVDFDDIHDLRFRKFRDVIPDDVADRVFILGVSSEPERLRAAFGASLELIGMRLVEACGDPPGADWSHDLVAVNGPEKERFRVQVCPRLMA